MSFVDPIVENLAEWGRKVLGKFYPIVSDPGFVFLPIPAVYELFQTFMQGHSDGQNTRRLGIIAVNFAVGYVAYKVGGPLPFWFNVYLLGGLAFYAIMKTLLLGPDPDRGIPDLDPCGNPIERHPGQPGSGGAGAC